MANMTYLLSSLLVIVFCVGSSAVTYNCTTDADCSRAKTSILYQVCSKVLTICQTGTCGCKPGQKLHSSRCGIERKISESCDHVTNFCPKSADCRNNICQCWHGYKPNYSNNSCIMDIKKTYAENCTKNTDCYDDHGKLQCKNGTCQCQRSRNWNDKLGKCVQNEVGSSCTEDKHCTPRANDCVNGTCACNTTTHVLHRTYWKDRMTTLCLLTAVKRDVSYEHECKYALEDPSALFCGTNLFCRPNCKYPNRLECHRPAEIPQDPNNPLPTSPPPTATTTADSGGDGGVPTIWVTAVCAVLVVGVLLIIVVTIICHKLMHK